ncbi:MAG: hypothetical protein WCO98_04145 [bacterium]
MQIILSTNCDELSAEITKTAEDNDAVICRPENMLDMLFSDAVILIIDPNVINHNVWEAYLEYQQTNAINDNTLLILLLPAEWSVCAKTPCELFDKPQNKLYHCYVDDIAAIQLIVNKFIPCKAAV